MRAQPEIIKGGISCDDRGEVRFCNDFDFKDVKRFYQVSNHSRGFIRAHHAHMNEGKYIYVAKGTAWICLMPLLSNEVGKLHLDENQLKLFVLSSTNPQVLYVPPGWSNGFQTLEEDTQILFFSTSTTEDSLGDDYRFPYEQYPVFQVTFR